MCIRKYVVSTLVLFCVVNLSVSVAVADWTLRQPGPFPEGMDVWFGNVYNKTAVHDGKLQVGGWTDSYYSLIRFNLSGLPQRANTAILCLYSYPKMDTSTTTPIIWYQLANQWHTGSVGINTPFQGYLLGPTPAPPVNSWYYVDITELYNEWRLGEDALNYGLLLAPQYNNNRFNFFAGSANSFTGIRPAIYVLYTPQANDSVLKLKWPLGTDSRSREVVKGGGYGGDWVRSCGGKVKIHNGTDYRATAGTEVFATEDGIVKEVFLDTKGGWAYNIVLEHNHPKGGRYTTVCWHVNPVKDVLNSNPGGFIPKGMHIANVADLTPNGNDTHFHFGVRIGPYTRNLSGTGGLPQDECQDKDTGIKGLLPNTSPSHSFPQK